MYHPGIVLDILSPEDRNVVAVDSTMQAVLKMWDENLITVLVDAKIGKRLKKKDVVLVDYRPIPNTNAPNLKVIKILKGSLAKAIWETYQNHFRKFRMKNIDMKKAGKTGPLQEEHYVG